VTVAALVRSPAIGYRIAREKHAGPAGCRAKSQASASKKSAQMTGGESGDTSSDRSANRYPWQ